MDVPTTSPPVAGPLAAFVERLRAAKPKYDWQPTIEPPQHYDRRLKICTPPDFTRPADSIDAARRMIREKVLEYLDMSAPAHILLVRTSPGTGKTTISVDIVDQLAAAGHRIGYAGPRHNFYLDILAKTNQFDQWYEWMPRQAGDEDTGVEQTCVYSAQINEWLAKGYQATDFCKGVCGWDYFNDECVYNRQKLRKERAIFIQHQHVTLGHPLDFTVIFGDESPLAAFCHEWKIPARWILPPGMDVTEPITEILSGLAAIAQNTESSIQGPALLELLGGPEYVLAACESFEIPLDALGAAEIHVADQVANTPYFHLPALVDLLKREAQACKTNQSYPHRIILANSFLTLLLRREPKSLPPHVIWLDATGRPEIYEKVFGRPVEVVDARPRTYGKIYQVVDRANGKSSMTGQAGDEVTAKATQVETVIERLIADRGYQNPSVIGFKAFSERTRLARIARVGHFYAARGTNTHEDADAIFIVGAPQSNIYDLVKMAKMLYFERDTAFKIQWVTRERVYAFADENGQGRSYPVTGFWNDPDLQAVLETIREDEIIQAAHRGRPVNHPVDIWLFTNIPIDALPPDELLTMREILGAPLGVDTFKWEKVQRLMAEQDTITVPDIVALGIHQETARIYMDIIETMPGWTRSATRIGSSKKPNRSVTRNKRG